MNAGNDNTCPTHQRGNAHHRLSLACASGWCARPAFSLVELLIVVVIISVLAGVVVTTLQPTNNSQLESVAEILVTDIAFARSLAVTNGSTYRMRFDRRENRYILDHTGSNSTFDTLPTTVFDDASDEPTQRVTDLDELPHVGSGAKIIWVQKVKENGTSTTYTAINQIEFASLGQLTGPERVEIWLGNGVGDDQLYLPVYIEPATGLATVGEFDTEIPQKRNNASKTLP